MMGRVTDEDVERLIFAATVYDTAGDPPPVVVCRIVEGIVEREIARYHQWLSDAGKLE